MERNKNKYCILLIGLPCSGKTTWRTKFLNKVDKTQWCVLSTDDLIEKDCIKNNTTYSQFFKTLDFSKYEKVFYQNLKNAIMEQKNIIIDQTNLSKKSRFNKIKFFDQEYIKVAIVFIVDMEEIYHRNNDRYKKYGKFIPNNVLESMKKSFEFPNFKEFDKIKIIKN